MSDSTWDDPNVTAYILGELSKDEADAFEQRLRNDPQLAEVVAEARNVTDQLQVMYTREPSQTLEISRREKITGISSPTPATAQNTKAWQTTLIAMATAAALLLLVGIPSLMKQTTKLGSVESAVAPDRNEGAMMGESPIAETESNEFSAMLEEDTDFSEEIADSAELESQFDAPGDTLGGSAIMGESKSKMAAPGVAADNNPLAADREATEAGYGTSARQQALEKSLAVGPTAGSGLKPAAMAPAPAGPASKRSSNAKMNRKMLAEGDEIGVLADGGQADPFGFADDASDDDQLASRDKFANISENEYKRVIDAPLSTFSVDVDTASYSKVREYLLRQNRLPPIDAVRVEEMVNYFDYEYLPPKDDADSPFAAETDIFSCPWNDAHRLARIALKGKTMKPEERPLSNIVFLLDTSGSMNSANKLPLVKKGMEMLLTQLGENDRVAIVVYAGSAGLVLDSTPATRKRKIENALNSLAAGGSTNGGQGIELAYQVARDNFIAGGVNRVILCTDGDFNVGTTNTGSLVRMVEKEAAGNIFLTVLGFGMGNHNDNMLEQISGRGNGNYAFIDTDKEAQKVLVDQVNGTLVTIAKDVKLQIEFNPRKVAAYRLIGYENRVLAKEDFNDDKKDAGEIGAGHAVTALYELIPAGTEDESAPPKVDSLKYQSPAGLTDAANRDESLTLKLRYKEPEGQTSKLVEYPVIDNEARFQDADHDARFAAAVANFGMQLRKSKFAGDWDLQDVIEVAQDAKGEDMSGLRAEFVEMVETAKKSNR